jgi:hypothetical protein
MTFNEWFYSEPYRAKYTNDSPAYLAAQEAWDAAHEECVKVVEHTKWSNWFQGDCVAAIRAKVNK